MPLFHHALPYSRDALHSWFSRTSRLPFAILLSSGFAKHRDSRFDIMVADPRITLITRGDITTITQDNRTRHSTEDPLDLLRQYQQAFMPDCPSNDDYPFIGGALGLLGYDLARRFERLPSVARADLQTPDMAVGLYDWALIADHHHKKLTLVSHNDSHSRLAWLQAQPVPETKPFLLTEAWQCNMTAEQYAEKFACIKQALLDGDCYQINLARRFHARYQGDEWQAFLRLNAQNQAPFSAFMRLPESVILSLSPERFLSLVKQKIETRPIKGTRHRRSDPQQDKQQAEELAHSVKDRAENLMIVDLLRNDIGRVAQPGSVCVPELFTVEHFPAVHHLVSTIQATLRASLHATDLLRACFPGGSITGAPKVRAMDIIDRLEPQRRNAWCGTIFYLSACGKMDSNITIRTLIAEQGRLYCSAGGGIVADSDMAAERQEIQDKISRILPCLAKEQHD